MYEKESDKLRHIKDAIGKDAWSGDPDDQSEDNYGYDQAGRLIRDKAEGIEQIDWTSDDKVARVLKADKTELRFRYGTSGERIEKSVIPQGKEQDKTSTLYANGAVLEKKREVVNDKTYDEVLVLKEQHLSEGMLTRERELQRIRYEEGKAPQPVITLNIPEAYASAERGAKTYALKDHLGSVRVTVSDVKLSDMQDNVPANFKAEVLSIARYDAFGSLQQGRQFSAKSYGYNGMEKDDEVKGAGNSYDYGARFYDPRAGRWLSVAPKAGAFPAHSPYHFALNNPVAFNDPDGQAPQDQRIMEIELPNGRVERFTREELIDIEGCLLDNECSSRGSARLFVPELQILDEPFQAASAFEMAAFAAAIYFRNAQLMRLVASNQSRTPYRRYAMSGPSRRPGRPPRGYSMPPENKLGGGREVLVFIDPQDPRIVKAFKKPGISMYVFRRRERRRQHIYGHLLGLQQAGEPIFRIVEVDFSTVGLGYTTRKRVLGRSLQDAYEAYEAMPEGPNKTAWEKFFRDVDVIKENIIKKLDVSLNPTMLDAFPTKATPKDGEDIPTSKFIRPDVIDDRNLVIPKDIDRGEKPPYHANQLYLVDW